MTDKKIKAWHFLKDDGTAYSCKIEPPLKFDEVGKIYSIEGDIVPCENGLHGSVNIMDALTYANGSLLCHVEIWGDAHEHDRDKICGRYRKILWKLDATNILHEFACRCAEDALKQAGNPDPRSVAVIKAKRDWVKGLITDEELDAARAAAWTACAAARAAAGAVRASTGAAWDAAWDAARDAVRASTGADRARQSERLTAMVNAAHRKDGKK